MSVDSYLYSILVSDRSWELEAGKAARNAYIFSSSSLSSFILGLTRRIRRRGADTWLFLFTSRSSRSSSNLAFFESARVFRKVLLETLSGLSSLSLVSSMNTKGRFCGISGPKSCCGCGGFRIWIVVFSCSVALIGFIIKPRSISSWSWTLRWSDCC